jgi:Fur family transcriptional regulator, ferric uptake regulator
VAGRRPRALPAEDRARRLDEVLARIRSAGERVTVARRAVVSALLEADGHATAEGLQARVQAGHPEVHMATIYRNLETLERLGLVEHTHLGHGPAVYHLADSLHQHLVCEVCGYVVEVPADLLRPVEEEVRASYGFVMRPGHFAVVGRCATCT